MTARTPHEKAHTTPRTLRVDPHPTNPTKRRKPLGTPNNPALTFLPVDRVGFRPLLDRGKKEVAHAATLTQYKFRAEGRHAPATNPGTEESYCSSTWASRLDARRSRDWCLRRPSPPFPPAGHSTAAGTAPEGLCPRPPQAGPQMSDLRPRVRPTTREPGKTTPDPTPERE
jgi:hypothetical protein